MKQVVGKKKEHVHCDRRIGKKKKKTATDLLVWQLSRLQIAHQRHNDVFKKNKQKTVRILLAYLQLSGWRYIVSRCATIVDHFSFLGASGAQSQKCY